MNIPAIREASAAPVHQRRLARHVVALCSVAAALAVVATPASASGTDAVEGTFVPVAHAEGDAVFAVEGHASDQDFIVTDDGVMVPVELPVGVEVAAGAEVEATATAGSAEVIGDIEAQADDLSGQDLDVEVQLETVQVVAQATLPRDGTAHRAYVVAIDDPRSEADVPLDEAVRSTQQALDYWVEEADGAIGGFTVAGAEVADLGGQCPTYTSLWSQVQGLFAHANFFGGTDHLVVYTPEYCTYPYSGIASVGSRLAGGVSHISTNDHHTVVHEIGHNLSLLHSNLSYSDGGVWKEQEYLGLYGPMSGGTGAQFAPGALGAAQRHFLDLPGHHDATEQMFIEMGMGDTRTITLNPVYAETGTTSVRLHDAASGETFFVEYRAGGGRDVDSFYTYSATRASTLRLAGGLVTYRPGVVVSRYREDGSVSVLASPSSLDRWDSALLEGSALMDESERFTIAVGRTTTQAVELTITTGGPHTSPFGKEIDWLRDNGISTNWADGTFRPLGHVTRDAMAAFLYRLAGEPKVALPARSPFSDVTPTSTEFYKEIVWLSQQGISQGWKSSRGTEFRPESRITRDAMAAFLYRYSGASAAKKGGPSFTDVARSSSEFYDEISWMAAAGISTGWADGTFRPLERVTREAMAAFLYRLSASGLA